MALPRKTRFYRVVRGLRLAMLELEANADAVVGAALARWCKECFPGLPKSTLPASSALTRAAAVIALVDFVKEGEFLEATYWLASAYAQLAGDERRKNLAMFFTPPSLTKCLLDELSASGVDFATRRFCDPACGGAAFLTPIAIRMRDALRARDSSPSEILEHVQSHLLGIDKDETLCKLSRHFLAMALHDEVLVTGVLPDFRVVEGDSLLEASSLLGTLDVVICNPPFRKMQAFEVQRCFNAFEDVIEAQPNLYALFIALCVRLLATGGTCALVTPTSFLSGQNFSKLRTFLLARTKVLGIGMVSDRQGIFIDVEQETALTLLRREDNGHSPSMRTEVSVVSRDGTYVDVGKCTLPNSGAAWPIPRSESDIYLLKSAAKFRAGLADYGYSIRIGSFVWNRDTRPTYPSAKSAARAKGGTAVPLLWSSDIAANRTLRFNGVPKSNKEPCFVNLGSKSHPSVVRRPSVLLQRVTSNDQPRRLVAAVVPKTLLAMYGGFVGENHTVILEQVSHEPALAPEELAILLGTPTVDRYFRCISGATNVSVFELSQLRLPEPGRLKAFLAQGHDLAQAARMTLDE